MEARLKMIISAAFTFTVIGFILFLLIIVTGFLGHCFGVAVSGYDQFLIIMTAAGVATFAVCFYTSCYRKWRKTRELNHNH